MKIVELEMGQEETEEYGWVHLYASKRLHALYNAEDQTALHSSFEHSRLTQATLCPDLDRVAAGQPSKGIRSVEEHLRVYGHAIKDTPITSTMTHYNMEPFLRD